MYTGLGIGEGWGDLSQLSLRELSFLICKWSQSYLPRRTAKRTKYKDLYRVQRLRIGNAGFSFLPLTSCRATSKLWHEYSTIKVVTENGGGAATELLRSISAGPTSPPPTGGRRSARIHQPGRPTPTSVSRASSFEAGSGAGEDRPRGDPRDSGAGAGPGSGRAAGARGGRETGTYRRPAAGGHPSPGGGEVRRRGSRAPADEGAQGPQQEGGGGAAQVQAEPEQDGAQPRASRRRPAAGPQAGEGHGGECGHGHGHPPAPAAGAPRGGRVLPGLRPLARGRAEAGAAAVGGIGVHAASCAAKDRHISCPAVPLRCPGRWPPRGASCPRRSRRRSGGRGSPRSCPRRRPPGGTAPTDAAGLLSATPPRRHPAPGPQLPAGRAQVAGPCCDFSRRSPRRSGSGGGPGARVSRGAESLRGPLSDSRGRPASPCPAAPRGGGRGPPRCCPAGRGHDQSRRTLLRPALPRPAPRVPSVDGKFCCRCQEHW